MPLLRTTKLPPPPELGEKTFWDYFPKRSVRRVVFMLIALGLVIFLRQTGGLSFGGLFDPAGSAPAGSARPAGQPAEQPFMRLQVKPPTNAAPASKSAP